MFLQPIAYLFALFPALLIIYGLIPSTSAVDKYVHTDFILLLHDNVQPRKDRPNDDIPALKKMLIEEFPKQIPVGAQETRLALVANKKTGKVATWNLITPFTGDVSEFEKAMNTIEAEELADDDNKRNRKLEDGLTFITENVFKEKSGQRPRVLVIYSTTESGRLKSAKEKIKELTSHYGVLVLLVLREFLETLEALNEELIEVAGDNGRSTPIGDVTTPLVSWIKEKIVNRTCNDPGLYEDDCFYESDGGCNNDKYTPKMKSNSGDCGDQPYVEIADMCDGHFSGGDPCMETCDALWPWSKQCDKDVACGGNASDARQGSYEWRQLQYCPTTLKCGECGGEIRMVSGSGSGWCQRPASMIQVFGTIMGMVLITSIG